MGVNNFVNSATTGDRYNNQLGRLDYNMTDKSRMYFDVRRTGYTQGKQDYFNNIAEGISTYRNNWGGTLDEVYMFAPTLVANARLNFTRMAEGHAVPSEGFDPTTLGFPSYMAANSVFLQLPIVTFTTFQSLGGNSTTSNNYPSQSLQFFGDVTKIKGSHTLKIGADLRQYRVNVINFGNSTRHVRLRQQLGPLLQQRLLHRRTRPGHGVLPAGSAHQRIVRCSLQRVVLFVLRLGVRPGRLARLAERYHQPGVALRPRRRVPREMGADGQRVCLLAA